MTGAQEFLFFRYPGDGAAQMGAPPGNGEKPAVSQPGQVKAAPGKRCHGSRGKRVYRAGNQAFFRNCFFGAIIRRV